MSDGILSLGDLQPYYVMEVCEIFHKKQ